MIIVIFLMQDINDSFSLSDDHKHLSPHQFR